MINLKVIYKIIGSLLFIEAALMSVCLIMAMAYGEDDMYAFLYAVGITAACGAALRYMGRDSGNMLSRRDAYLVVSLAWVLFSLFGTLPFVTGGYIKSFTDAYFETMSGFTTTGATIIDDVECLPHAILFWRSLTHWIGGLGIVFFTIALLPSLIGGSVKIFAAESTGPIKMKLHPKISTNSKWIGSVYIILTLACALSYMFFGMDWFDAINYSMSTTGTGGFATHNASIAHFQSPGIEYSAILFCFLSGTNFTLLYFTMAKLRFRELFMNSEFRLYFILVAAFSLFIACELVVHNGYDVEHALRSSLFQVTAFITTTGFFSDDAGLWPHVTWVVLSFCMFIGACSGSTSGGLKCVRGVMLLRIVRNEFRQILHPNAVLPLKIDSTNVPNNKRVTLLAFLTVDLILILVCSFIFIVQGIESTNAVTVTLSSLGNVGPALGSDISPTMSWSSLPDNVKWICTLLMLVGRLEIFSVLVIFTSAFWKDN
jgi:trk system potassium uptake protein TrkH